MRNSELVLLAPVDINDNKNSKNFFVKLKHPRSDELCVYIWNVGAQKLFEVQRIVEKHRSWIIGSTIKTDGGMYLCTPFDPTFMLIPVCQKQKTKFVSGSCFLSEDESYSNVFSQLCDIERRLKLLCQTKNVNSLNFYRYDENLTLDWLVKKVNAVCEAASVCKNPVVNAQLRLIYTDKSTSESFDMDSIDSRAPNFTSNSLEAKFLSADEVSKSVYLNLAYQIVSDYVSPDLANKLRERIGLQVVDSHNQMSNVSLSSIEVENEDPLINKKSQDVNIQPKEDYSNALKQIKSKPDEPPSKKAKIPKGVQSITNFFGKK